MPLIILTLELLLLLLPGLVQSGSTSLTKDFSMQVAADNTSFFSIMVNSGWII
jgi:hypothetical protein